MPTLDTDGWELESAEERHNTYSRQFQIPQLQERRSLQRGDRVKLLFLFLNGPSDEPTVGCERMWVTIVSSSPGAYSGRLESSPVTSSRLRAGDTVHFGPEHIATVLLSRSDPRHPHYRSSAAWLKRIVLFTLTAGILASPAVYVSAVLYLLAIDAHAGLRIALSFAVVAVTAPLLYVPPAMVVGACTALSTRIAGPRMRTLLPMSVASAAGAFVGWRFTHNTPAMATWPAIAATALVWCAFALIACRVHVK